MDFKIILTIIVIGKVYSGVSESSWPVECRQGKHQSPVDLTRFLHNCVRTNSMKLVSTHYLNMTNPEIIVQEHNTFSIKDNMGYVTWQSNKISYIYLLNRIDFKMPSE